MNDTPTSGPIATSRIHHDRDATSSRHSFFSSQTKGAPRPAALRERKKNLFEDAPPFGLRREFVERALAAHASAAEQDEPIADARRVVDLMNRQEQRAAARGVGAQGLRHLADLAQVEAVERLVGEQDRLRRDETDREQRALALALDRKST